MKTLKIYGPPGTGKTHAMLGLFEGELKKLKPNRVAFLTFTRAARIEALERSGRDELELPFVKTIHAICYRMLNVSQEQMVKPKHLRAFGKKLGLELSGTNADPLALDALTGAVKEVSKGDRLLQMNHLGRHRKIHLKEAMKDAPTDIDWHFAKWFTEAYREWKKTEGLYDFTDLLTEYLRRDNVGPLSIDALFIDEAQDLSLLQWEVARKLGSYADRRYLAGDDDQAIFTWAGASPELFNAEPADENRVLPRSYRIPRRVHELSQRVIQRVRKRFPKEFEPRDELGEHRPVGYLTHEHLGDSSTFVLYRNHHRGRALATTLEDLGWAFDGAFSPLSQPQVRDALETYDLFQKNSAVSPFKVRSFLDLANPEFVRSDARRLSNTSRALLEPGLILTEGSRTADFADVLIKLPKLDFFKAAIASQGLKAVLNPSVTLLSIHQSKGRQADTVVLDLEMATKTYDGYLKDPDSEHRVFYVGITRTKQRLLTLMPTDAANYQL